MKLVWKQHFNRKALGTAFSTGLIGRLAFFVADAAPTSRALSQDAALKHGGSTRPFLHRLAPKSAPTSDRILGSGAKQEQPQRNSTFWAPDRRTSSPNGANDRAAKALSPKPIGKPNVRVRLAPKSAPTGRNRLSRATSIEEFNLVAGEPQRGEIIQPRATP